MKTCFKNKKSFTQIQSKERRVWQTVWNQLTHEVSKCGLVMGHQVVNNGSPAEK